MCTGLACWNHRCDAKEFQAAVEAELAGRIQAKVQKKAKTTDKDTPAHDDETHPLEEQLKTWPQWVGEWCVYTQS